MFFDQLWNCCHHSNFNVLQLVGTAIEKSKQVYQVWGSKTDFGFKTKFLNYIEKKKIIKQEANEISDKFFVLCLIRF
ncbi:MAG: hypothetical protein NZ853_05535 [Leptospiraceae bacterium]|nr:hypothetical protein [Leptospiraceae bacterium]MDW7976590.1 hypothetical protein [Leptospiraceae bacterium]